MPVTAIKCIEGTEFQRLFWHHHFGQAGAAAKCIVPNTSDRVGDHHLVEASAATNCRVSNGWQLAKFDFGASFDNMFYQNRP